MTEQPPDRQRRQDNVHNKTLGTAAAVSVLLLAVVSVGCATGDTAGTPSATASAPATTPTAEIDWRKQPSAKLTVRLDLSKLKRGPDPKVPWYASGVIHDGSQVTPVEHGMGEWAFETVEFRAAAGAYGVSVNHPEGGNSWHALIDREGKVLERADIKAVSADGSLVAWLEAVPKSRSSVPVVRDLKTGRNTRGKQRPIAGLDGFAGSKVLYTTLVRGGYLEGMALWDPVADTEEPVSPDIANGHLLTDDVMLASVRMEGERGWCQDLYSFEQRKPLRKPCSGGSFQAIRNSPYFTWTVRDLGVIVDARTGQGVLRLTAANGQNISDLSGEPGGNLLVKVSGEVASDIGGDEGKTAIVRCSLAGECELASDVYEPEPGTERSLIELPE
jgi:hypothetical protein